MSPRFTRIQRRNHKFISDWMFSPVPYLPFISPPAPFTFSPPRSGRSAAKGFRETLLAPPVGTRNSSGDEIANVNFFNDGTVHVLQNTIDSCINSATDRRCYVLKCMFTKFSKITQCNDHYAVQGHSRSPILLPIESSYDFLLVINTNLHHILHRFQVMADYWSNFRSREGSASL